MFSIHSLAPRKVAAPLLRSSEIPVEFHRPIAFDHGPRRHRLALCSSRCLAASGVRRVSRRTSRSPSSASGRAAALVSRIAFALIRLYESGDTTRSRRADVDRTGSVTGTVCSRVVRFRLVSFNDGALVVEHDGVHETCACTAEIGERALNDCLRL